jgi:uncharacterized phiE125 gp8 family phage protein
LTYALNQYALNQSTAPTSHPITLDEARLYCRVTDDIEDSQIEGYIAGAVRLVEEFTSRQLMTATWDLYCDRFPSGAEPIWLPRSPVQSVTSITYLDSDGVSQTWTSSNYRVDVYSEPARINLEYQIAYPAVRYVNNAIRIRFAAGYTTAALVPAGLKNALLMLIEAMYVRKDDVFSETVQNVLMPFVVGDEFTCYGQASYGI